MLTDEEAIVLALGLQGVPRLGLALDPTAVAGARAKLERVLPAVLRGRVRALEASVALDPGPPIAPHGALVTLFGEAAHHGRRVQLRYRSRADLETARTVDPYGVVRWSRAWYLVGYCHLRAGPRTFRLDRVIAAEPLEETFPPPVDFDSYDYVTSTMATFPGRWPVELVLGLTIEEAHRQIGAASGTLEVVGDKVLLRGRFDDLDAVARWLVTLRCPVVVRQPLELQEEIRRLAGEITAMADER
jgi:predicted DNA-binding transcriptional regulator YafY